MFGESLWTSPESIEFQRIATNSGESQRDPQRNAEAGTTIRRMSANFNELLRIPANTNCDAPESGEYSADVRRTFSGFLRFLRIPAECHPNELRSRKIRSPDRISCPDDLNPTVIRRISPNVRRMFGEHSANSLNRRSRRLAAGNRFGEFR